MEDIDMDELDDYFRELRGERRSRATARTPGSGRRRKTPQTPASRGRSRSRATAARRLSMPSETKSMSVDRRERLYREAVKLTAAPKDDRSKFDIYHLNKGKSMDQIDRMWNRRKAGKYKLKTRKVRHKNARTVSKKMPAGGKPYARGRKSMKKPKGAYRGAVMPRWAKGETKHILMNDNCTTVDPSAVPGTTDTHPFTNNVAETTLKIGDLKKWCLNPCIQGHASTSRNGRTIDGTYLRVQGHIRNSNTASNGSGKAYVRMLVLSVKGGSAVSTVSGSEVAYAGSKLGAPFIVSQLFKKIDGKVVPFEAPATGTVGSGSAAVRTLQLPINKSLYTVLYDQKMQLSNTGESFGSSDRLFDAKIALKQRTSFADEHADSFEKNQLVFVVYTVDPQCADSTPTADDIHLEFESKYSYKDL